ncbi:MAG: hypothetical protein AB1428_10210 [Bacteroidota bacterium]
MAETLGSLCDKLTVVKLKQWHTADPERRKSLALQESQLSSEINEFIAHAIAGRIPPDRLVFAANKVYASRTGDPETIPGALGESISRLATVNCSLWHEQEKVYEFERVPPDQKDEVVKKLAQLNLERNACIEKIDSLLRNAVTQGKSQTPT